MKSPFYPCLHQGRLGFELSLIEQHLRHKSIFLVFFAAELSAAEAPRFGQTSFYQRAREIKLLNPKIKYLEDNLKHGLFSFLKTQFTLNLRPLTKIKQAKPLQIF